MQLNSHIFEVFYARTLFPVLASIAISLTLNLILLCFRLWNRSSLKTTGFFPILSSSLLSLFHIALESLSIYSDSGFVFIFILCLIRLCLAFVLPVTTSTSTTTNKNPFGLCLHDGKMP